MMQVNGKTIKYGDNVDTDVIIPARYLHVQDLAQLALHCMEDLDPAFAQKCEKGDVVVVGANFGCGSSREHAPLVLRESGVGLIIAESFARIFYRNAINIGLPIVECPAAARDAREGDRISMNFDSGIIVNHMQGKEYQAEPFPPFIQTIITSGGLVQAVQKGVFQTPIEEE